MALSEQTRIGIEESVAKLRETLAFAAKSEHAAVVGCLTESICKLESIESVTSCLEQFDLSVSDMDKLDDMIPEP